MLVIRGRFEGLCTGVFRRCVDSGVISDLLSEGGVTRGDVDQVIMAGGSCNIPLLHSLVEAEFPGCEILVSSPDEVVATGCALQAGLMRERWEGREEEEEEGVEIPCSPYDLWIKVIPLKQRAKFYYLVENTSSQWKSFV